MNPVAVLRGRIFGDASERGLLVGAVGTLTLNVVTLALNFVLTIVLTRTLGATGYGAYAFALAWAMVLSVPATLGLSALVVRSVAGYVSNDQVSLLRGFLRRANQMAGASSFLIVGTAAATAWLTIDRSEGLLGPFLIGLVLIPIFALNTVRQSALQGLGRVILARVPETLIVPLASLVFVGAAYAALDEDFTATWAVGLGVLAATLALAVGALVLRRSLPFKVIDAQPSYEMHIWGPSALRLLVASLLMALSGQLGTILLGVLRDTSEAGVFSVAQRVAVFASFFSLAASYPLMPAVARLHASAGVVELQRVLSRAGRLVLLGSVPLVIGLIALSGRVIELFGGEFDQGVRAMQILVLGELSSLLIGYAGLALVMTGNERDFTLGVGLRVGLAFVAMMVLIPNFGVTGAAIGTASAAVVSNALFGWLAWRRLHVFTPPVARVLH